VDRTVPSFAEAGARTVITHGVQKIKAKAEFKAYLEKQRPDLLPVFKQAQAENGVTQKRLFKWVGLGTAAGLVALTTVAAVHGFKPSLGSAMGTGGTLAFGLVADRDLAGAQKAARTATLGKAPIGGVAPTPEQLTRWKAAGIIE
jgi:hypothetical protein